MRRSILTLFAALAMLLSFGAVASAEETEPEPCVPGVEVWQFTNDDTGNIIEVTATTVCDPDYDITYDYETVAYWRTDSRGNGYWMTAAEHDAWLDAQRTGGNKPDSGRYGR